MDDMTKVTYIYQDYDPFCINRIACDDNDNTYPIWVSHPPSLTPVYDIRRCVSLVDRR
jgi:hypothetical protein